jgi:hypothetical protein
VTTFDPIERVRRARRQAATVVAFAAVAVLVPAVVVVRVWVGWSGASAPDDPPAAVAPDSGPDLRWRPFRPGHDLPESVSAGPRRRVGGQVGGFARNELGAALAAIHLASRIDPTNGPGVFLPTIKEQVVGDVQQLRENTENEYARVRREQGKANGEPLQSQGTGRLAGYHLISQNPEEATVDVIVGIDDGSFWAYRYELQWVDDDWHLVAPTGGNPMSARTKLPALPPGAVALSKGT